MRGAFALFVTLALAALSGCVEPVADAGDTAAVAQEAADAIAEVAQEPGHLAGLVLDADGQPVEGATVTLDGLSLVQTSEADGSFAFVDLAAGAAVLRAVADGFEDGALDVAILPGHVTRATVSLVALPAAPRYEVLEFEGHSDLLGLSCACWFGFDVGPGLHTVILEAVVDDAMFTFNQGAWYGLSLRDDEGNGTSTEGDGLSPLRAELPVGDLTALEHGDLMVQPKSDLLFPETLWRGFTAYVTLVYDAAPEPGYTAIPAEE